MREKSHAISIPMLKKNTLNDRITVPIEAELKKRLIALKAQYGADYLEFIRELIRQGIPQAEEHFAKQA